MDDRYSWRNRSPSPPPPPRSSPFRGIPTRAGTVESLETAVQSLVTRWETRRRWQLLLGCCPVVPRPASDGGRATWRTRLAGSLESTPVHLATLCLIVVDLVLTALDLSSSLVSCSRGDGGGGRGERFYFWGSVAILSVLSARVGALAVALGSSFLRSPGHVVDAAVVVGALLLELLKQGAGGEAGGLLVVVSLWRVVRVVEGAFELSNEAVEAQIESIGAQLEVLKDENRLLQDESLDKEKRIAALEEEVARSNRTM